MLNDHCHRVSTHLQSINIIIIIIIIISQKSQFQCCVTNSLLKRMSYIREKLAVKSVYKNDSLSSFVP